MKDSFQNPSFSTLSALRRVCCHSKMHLGCNILQCKILHCLFILQFPAPDAIHIFLACNKDFLVKSPILQLSSFCFLHLSPKFSIYSFFRTHSSCRSIFPFSRFQKAVLSKAQPSNAPLPQSIAEDDRT